MKKKLQELRAENAQKKKEILAALNYTDPFTFLMELSILFEQQYGMEDKLVNIQMASVALSKLLKDVFRTKKFSIPQKNTEEIHIQLLKCTAKAHEEGVHPSLEALFQRYISDLRLEDFIQIDQYDKNCEVVSFEEGCVTTKIKNFFGLQAYSRDGLKSEALTEYYFNKGKWDAFELLRNGELVLQGANEDDQSDFFDQVARQIAALAYLEHYGVEAEFQQNGKTYNTFLLIQLLSFLIIYTRSRYGVFWEAQNRETDVVKRIVKVWQANIDQGGRQTPGPLFISSWTALLERTQNVIGDQWSKEEIERHLAFFSTDLGSPTGYLNILETPLLRLGDWVAFFARPLMLQNTFIPTLKPLTRTIKKKQPEGAQDRNKRSAKRLGERFSRQGFKVMTDKKLYAPRSNKLVTDVDVFALKDNYLFLIQVKMTFPKLNLKEAANHQEALIKAAEQTEESLNYFENYWPYFREQNLDKGIPDDLNWESLQVVPLIVSTSIEWDRTHFSDYIKISQFELERYLENDAYLLHLDPLQNIKSPGCKAEYLFHPEEDQLSGEKLKTLIEQNALWEYLEPAVLASE